MFEVSFMVTTARQTFGPSVAGRQVEKVRGDHLDLRGRALQRMRALSL